jgi:hypothetical protein
LANRTEPESYQEFETLPARVAGVLRSPHALFTSVIERPRWAAMMLFTLLITAVCGAALMETGVGRQALVDQWERTALAFGREVSDDRYAELVAMSEYGPAYALLSAVVAGPALTCGVAAAIVGVFSAAGGGDATYKQVLAIVAHAGVILALRQVVATPFNYARETLASPATLGHLLPMFDEASLPARFFGAIDLFVVWWVIVLAIGVAVLYRRSARSTALVFIGSYVGFAALLAIAMAVSGGTV